MADNDSLKATPAEVKKRTVEALMRERAGYEQRLNGAEEGSDVEKMLEGRVDQVNAQLRAFGSDAAPPAKRAERRPATVSARAER